MVIGLPDTVRPVVPPERATEVTVPVAEVETLTKNTDQYQGAKNIWQYMRNNFVCTDDNNKYLSQPLKKTFQTKKGNVADIKTQTSVTVKDVAGYYYSDQTFNYAE